MNYFSSYLMFPDLLCDCENAECRDGIATALLGVRDMLFAVASLWTTRVKQKHLAFLWRNR
jgi:hypothetical protein